MTAKGFSFDKVCPVAGDYDERDIDAGFSLIFHYDDPALQTTKKLTPRAAYMMQRALKQYVDALAAAGKTPTFWVQRQGVPDDSDYISIAGEL